MWPHANEFQGVRRVNLRTVISGTCAGAIAVAVTGCGGSGDSPHSALHDDPVAAVRKAPDVTRGAGSSRWETTTTLRSAGKTIVLRGSGSYQYARSMGTLSLQMPPEAGLKAPLSEVITPDALYVRGTTRSMPDKWVKLDLPTLAENSLVSSGSLDPSTSLQMLRGVNEGVRHIGTERLRGVQVHHFSGSLDLHKALAVASPQARPIFAAAVKSLASATIPFEVYLDDRGRLCKINQVMEVPTRNEKTRQTVRIVTASELYAFGTPVVVKVPPPSEVVQASGGERRR
jgi:hypothetical protein